MLSVENIFGDPRLYMLPPTCPVVRSMGEIVESGKPFLWMPSRLPMFLQDSEAIQYSLDTSKKIEAHKVEDHVPVFRESIQVHSPEASAFGLPAPTKKLMSDAGKVSCKSPPHITMDSSLYDLVVDPGVPSSTAAGSRDPDPHPPSPKSIPKASSSSSPPF